MTMKKLLWLALGTLLAVSLSAVAVVSGLPNPAIFTGTVSSTKACAANFARVTPNLCWHTGGSPSGTNIGTACTAVATPSAQSVALVVEVHMSVQSANAVALRSLTAIINDDSSACAANNRATPQLHAQEFVATPAQTIAAARFQFVIPTATRGSSIGAAASSGTTNVSIAVWGYYD
jgi:hypothetical protein